MYKHVASSSAAGFKCSICTIYFLDVTQKQGVWGIFLTSSRLTRKDICIIGHFPSCVCLYTHSVPAKVPKKMFHNPSKHISEQLLPFSCSHSLQMGMNGILELEISLHRATLVENMCRLRPHCTRMYPSSTRGTAFTKTFTALWKNTVQPATTWVCSHLSACILI